MCEKKVVFSQVHDSDDECPVKPKLKSKTILPVVVPIVKSIIETITEVDTEILNGKKDIKIRAKRTVKDKTNTEALANPEPLLTKSGAIDKRSVKMGKPTNAIKPDTDMEIISIKLNDNIDLPIPPKSGMTSEQIARSKEILRTLIKQGVF